VAMHVFGFMVLLVELFFVPVCGCLDRLCGLVIRVPGYRYRGPVSILGAIRFSEKWNGVHSAS
jgi:hypothetical protein